MNQPYDRRQVLKAVGGACAAFLLPRVSEAAEPGLRLAGRDVEIQLASVSEHTFRLTVLPINGAEIADVPTDGSLVRTEWGPPIAKLSGELSAQTFKVHGFKSGNLTIRISPQPLTFAIETADGKRVQQIK